jgi:hypothetical protein
MKDEGGKREGAGGEVKRQKPKRKTPGRFGRSDFWYLHSAF